jgi:hypothetical protein
VYNPNRIKIKKRRSIARKINISKKLKLNLIIRVSVGLLILLWISRMIRKIKYILELLAIRLKGVLSLNIPHILSKDMIKKVILTFREYLISFMS